MANGLGYRDNPPESPVGADIIDSLFDNSELFAPAVYNPFAQQQQQQSNNYNQNNNRNGSSHYQFQQYSHSIPGLIGNQSDPFAYFGPSYHTNLNNSLLPPPTPPGAPQPPDRPRDLLGLASLFPDFNPQPGLPDIRLPWEQPAPAPAHQQGPFASLRTQQPSAAAPPSQASHPDIGSLSSATPFAPSSFAAISRAARRGSNDDYFLAALVNGDFSSPSLPPISSSPRPSTRPQSRDLPRPLDIGGNMSRPTGRTLPTIHRARTSGGGVVDLTKEEPDFDAPNYGVDPSTPALTMPTLPTPRRRNTSSAARPGGEPSRKRRGSAASSSRPGKARRKDPFQDDLSSLFGDDAPTDSREHDHSDSIDLSNATEVPQNLMAPRVDNRVKLGKFQCVICMDDVTALTVTHCGHLFCSECLHSALHIDSMKRTCPVCRTKVDLKDKKGKNTKSYYHLELKVLTATKKGKRPAS